MKRGLRSYRIGILLKRDNLDTRGSKIQGGTVRRRRVGSVSLSAREHRRLQTQGE